MSNILLKVFYLTIITMSVTNFNKDEISNQITDEVERTLSIQLPFGLHTFPENVPIAIKIAHFKETDKLYFVLIDYPINEKIENKKVYVFSNKMGRYELSNDFRAKFLDKYFKQDIYTLFEKNFIKKQISLSKDKAQQRPKLNDEIVKQNQNNLDKVFESVRKYFLSHPELKNKYGNQLTIEMTVDIDDLIVNDDFVVTKVYSDKNKDVLYGWVYCKDDNKKPLDKFRFKEIASDDGWTNKIINQNTLKKYNLSLD